VKRDFDLIRLLLLEIEGEEQVNLSEYTQEQVRYHTALLIEAGLLNGEGGKKVYRGYLPYTNLSLTWKSHEFLDQIKNKSVWNEARKCLADQGLESFQAYHTVLPIIINEVINIKSNRDVILAKDHGIATKTKH